MNYVNAKLGGDWITSQGRRIRGCGYWVFAIFFQVEIIYGLTQTRIPQSNLSDRKGAGFERKRHL